MWSRRKKGKRESWVFVGKRDKKRKRSGELETESMFDEKEIKKLMGSVM